MGLLHRAKTNSALKQNSGSAEAPPPVLNQTQD
jgi:hypothetical protein